MVDASTPHFQNAGHVLAQPLAAIHATNAIDCYYLGLLDRQLLREYLLAILSGLQALKPNADISVVRNTLSAAWRHWADSNAKNKNLDKRQLVSLAAFSSHAIRTVMAFSSFCRTYSAVVEAAKKLLSAGPTSKYSALRNLPDSTENYTEAQVDQIIQCLQKIGTSASEPLVLESKRRVWCAPVDQASHEDADRLRAKLGLLHLPYAGDPANRTLISLEYNKDELEAGCELKRPALFDQPGPRFRALSLEEMDESCSSIKAHGMTVDLNSAQFADGEAELVFLAKDTASLMRWSVLGCGKLTGPHSRKEWHAQFADHLTSNKPANAVICRYRRKPDGVQQELATLLER